MPRQPLIGIAPNVTEPKPKRELVGAYRTYLEAVQRAGGLPVILTPDTKWIPQYLRLVDALLLIGGGDIHPKFFRWKKSPAARLQLSRDLRTTFDLAVAKAFLKAGKPILGICLGCQTLNVALGGDLIQDISTEWPEALDHRTGNHPIILESGSQLRRIVGKDLTTVNSRHHQALGKVGRQVKVVALSPDQIVEGIEVERHPFAIGVQWHPEDMPRSNSTRLLFRAFLKACGLKAGSGSGRTDRSAFQRG